MIKKITIPALLLGVLCSCAGAADNLAAVLSRKMTPKDGKESFERSLKMGNMKLTYTGLAVPAQNGVPTVENYSDKMDFPQGNGGYQWGCGVWMNLFVKPAGGGAEFCVNTTVAQSGVYALEAGPRAMVDAVWPLAADTVKPMLGTRFIRVPGDDKWFLLEIYLDPAAKVDLSRISVETYPYITTGTADRRRWVSTLAGDYGLTADARTQLDPAKEWGMVLHNKYVHETGGCLVLFDPDEVAACSVKGIYPVATEVVPKPGLRRLRLAFGYFWDQPYSFAVEELRAEAKSVLARLRKTDWEAKVDWPKLTAGWAARKETFLKQMDETMANSPRKAEFDKIAAPLLAQGDAYAVQAAAAAANAKVERAVARDIAGGIADMDYALGELKTKLYEAGLKRLMEE